MPPAISAPDLTDRPFRLAAERTMALSPDVLFRAWTQQIDRWFAAPGSALMRGEANAVFYFETHFQAKRQPHGRFLRLEPGRLVELTWVTGGAKGAETVVTVELSPAGNETLVRLSHAGFPDEPSMRQHEKAWPRVLAQLERRMSEGR